MLGLVISLHCTLRKLEKQRDDCGGRKMICSRMNKKCVKSGFKCIFQIKHVNNKMWPDTTAAYGPWLAAGLAAGLAIFDHVQTDPSSAFRLFGFSAW